MASSLCLSNLFQLHLNGNDPPRILKRRRNRCRRDFVASSSHSNPRIIKSNRRSPPRKQFSSYSDGDDDEEEGNDFEFSDDDSTEIEDLNPNLQGTWMPPRTRKEKRLSKTGQSLQLTYSSVQEKHGRNIQLKDGKSAKSRFHHLCDDFNFDEKWFPLIDYLSTFGLRESHYIQIYERHMPSLRLNVASAQERLEFLLKIGVKHKDIRKIILRQPQILEYTVENNLKSHVAFLVSLGVPDSRIGHVISACPSFFSYSVEHSLKPTIRYLVEEVGISKSDVSKVVQLSPQILVQRLDNSWMSRFFFLSKELGAPRDSIVKMVAKHPQLLHYSIEDGILPRINFLRSIGMHNSDILKVLTSLTQVLSLSLEDNLKPKYLYLVNELQNEVQSLTKYPTYLSLSLQQRIRPRHRFLVSLKKAPKGAFPLSSLVPTDECFCKQWAGTSLEKYFAFRQTLLLYDFAKKYERRG